MCDTFVVVTENEVLFAKNSDRDPNEEQILEWAPASRHSSKTQKCTWIEVDQVKETQALLISRPHWMWGAEMGTNEAGVVIGNEAVFTKEKVAKVGLTGMDLLRLALERADSAKKAVEIIIDLIQRFTQGGSCSLFNPNFRYFSSFLIADASSAYVLETVGKKFAVEQVTKGVRSISNGLTIRSFAEEHSDFLKTKVSACRIREKQSKEHAENSPSLRGLIAALRHHRNGSIRYSWANGDMSSLCMHAGGLLASSQTTASWVSRLTINNHDIWATGTSAPCMSLFKPFSLSLPVTFSRDGAGNSFWWQHEILHRLLLKSGERVVAEYVEERNTLEQSWFVKTPDTVVALSEEQDFRNKWIRILRSAKQTDPCPFYAKLYWAVQNKRAARIARGTIF